jgi:hypothetical protein
VRQAQAGLLLRQSRVRQALECSFLSLRSELHESTFVTVVVTQEIEEAERIYDEDAA